MAAMDWDQADRAPITAVSQDLFDSEQKTRTLAYHLSISIGSLPYNRAAGQAMWDEYLANEDGSKPAPFWYRGNITRALADLGTDIHKIRFRRS